MADVIGVVALGGALGALGRYGLSVSLPGQPGSVPWATFAANVSGCLLIGILMVSLSETSGASPRPHRLVRPFLGVGVLGGFTTFSTYVLETQQLASAGAPRLAALYLFGTLAAALTAVQVGIVATRVVVRVRTRRAASRL